MTATEYAVTVHVFTDDAGHVARAAEILGRAAAGLALDGIDASLRISRVEDESDPS